MFKAVFFDFGGTLMDIETDKIAHYEIMNAIVKKYKLRNKAKELYKRYQDFISEFYKQVFDYWVFHRDKNIEFFINILKENGIIANEKDKKWYYKIYLAKHKKYVKLYRNCRGVLKWLKNKKLHLGIISDGDDDYVHFQLKANKIHHFFDSIITSALANAPKPHERIFNLALKKANCKGNETIFIGDTYDKDIVGGKKFGMTTIFYNRKNIETNEKYVIKDWKEGKRVLEELLKNNKKEIKILQFGEIAKEDIQELKEELLLHNFNAVILNSEKIPENSFNKIRGQYLANNFLQIAKNYEGRILCITDVDLYVPNLNFIFGLAEINGKVCIISLYRLKSKNRKIYIERMIKESIHELGHTFGLKHCENKFCVMHFSNCLADTDIKSSKLCEKCENILYLKSINSYGINRSYKEKKKHKSI